MSSSAPLAFQTNDKKQSDVHKHVILDDIQVLYSLFLHIMIIHSVKGF